LHAPVMLRTRGSAKRLHFIKDFKENVWGAHWTPESQKDVADRIYGMLAANGVIRAKPASSD
jgi:hypothetical protein